LQQHEKEIAANEKMQKKQDEREEESAWDVMLVITHFSCPCG
jgi:hypothetical protein